MSLLRKRIFWWELLAIVLCLLFAVAGSIVAVHRFWQYEVFYYDFGIFDQAIRHLAKFQPPVIEHYDVGGKIIWADHLHPGIALLAPIYWFTQKSEALLIAQAVIMGLSGYVIFRTSVKKLKSYLPSVAILVSYLLFVGLQNAAITDFHELAVMTLPLTLAYWAILMGRRNWFIAFFLLCLSFKEVFFMMGVGLAFFVFFYRPAWRKLAVSLAIGSIAYGFLAIKVIIPYLKGGAYSYIEQYEFAHLLERLFWPPLKLKTIFNLFWSFLFLPLFYLPTLPMIAINLIPRFLSANSGRWDLGMHYNAEIAPTLAISTLIVFINWQKRFSRRTITLISLALIANAVALHVYFFRGPLALAYKPAFYAHSSNFQFLDTLIAQVPKDATVMTQNNLAARFTGQQVWLLRHNYEDYQPDYIIFDTRSGQNPNNFYGLKDREKLYALIKQDPHYALIYATGEQFAFKRNK